MVTNCIRPVPGLAKCQYGPSRFPGAVQFGFLGRRKYYAPVTLGFLT
jgi:hypothetical protein